MSRDQAEGLRTAAGGWLEGAARIGSAASCCRVLAVTSGKGGVGKTNVAVNLSLAFREAGARVLLLDADLGLANVDVLLGLSPEYTLQHVFRREAHPQDIVLEGPLGLKILPGGSGIPELANLGALEVVRLLGSLRALERDYDILVIDTAPGIASAVTRFALAADNVILVSAPEPAAMLDAYSLLKVLKAGKLSAPVHLLVNMVRREGEDDYTHRSLSAVAGRYLGMSLSLLGSLPYDESITRSVKAQQPFILHCRDSQAAQQLRRIAARFLKSLNLPRLHAEPSYFARLLNAER
ncbi:MinD/ParA family protein [bacterium]|nr:MinD/ParA family protein [bacterium]